MLLKTSEQARLFGSQIAERLKTHNPEDTYSVLSEVLKERTPFRLLDLVGAALNAADQDKADSLLDEVAHRRTEGGWVVIASALRERLPDQLSAALEKSRIFIMQANIWYGCDIFGERVPGPALIAYFQESLACLAGWRSDPDHWVRRALGVAGHFWAKRAHGSEQYFQQTRRLLDFLSPMLEERDYDAAKGVGWALKTIGRYYPAIAADFLREQLLVKKRKTVAIVRRKALLYLPAQIKKEFSG
jgi:3-methyladenine DNA glycosylase AlkD